MSSHSLTLADPEAEWAGILPTLESFLPGPPEALYSALVSGEAVLFKADEGFIAVAEQRQRDGLKSLFVWAVSGKGGLCIRRHWDELADIARAMGCSEVAGRVVDDRVARLLERCGWHQKFTEYARAV